jgi:hypothetical protein
VYKPFYANIEALVAAPMVEQDYFKNQWNP